MKAIKAPHKWYYIYKESFWRALYYTDWVFSDWSDRLIRVWACENDKYKVKMYFSSWVYIWEELFTMRDESSWDEADRWMMEETNWLFDQDSIHQYCCRKIKVIKDKGKEKKYKCLKECDVKVACTSPKGDELDRYQSFLFIISTQMFKPSKWIKCLRCWTICVSKWRWQLVQCRCLACFIDDMWQEWIFRIWGNKSDYEIIDIIEDMPEEVLHSNDNIDVQPEDIETVEWPKC